ncbi:MAG: hypothetical protein VB140_02670 [Burkholderia sp.]|nr:MAG: hypothetical protein E5299_00728 [Burkholderia gladioli]
MIKISRSASIAHDYNNSTLSKEQKKFNSLIKQIEKRRKRLRTWEEITPLFQKQFVNELLPLEQIFYALQLRKVYRLDQIYEHLTKTERKKVALFIVELAGDLIKESENEDQALKTIYDKYSPINYESQHKADIGKMKSMIEAMFCVDFGDGLDLNSPEVLLQSAEANLQKLQAELEAKRKEKEVRRSQQKKSSRQQADEVRTQEAQAQIGFSIREVYRKLASALHPDREIDPNERERKTQLMQRVNEAYQKKTFCSS